MKYFLIITGIIVSLSFIGYKYIDYKFIQFQERSYKELALTEIKESPRYFPDSLKLKDKVFWKLIASSKEEHPDNFSAQMKYLTVSLSKLPNEQIVGFEMTLREKVIQLWDYKIKSLYQIIYGEYISTDAFIYFRFWIVSNGEKFFNKALRDTDELADKIKYSDDGEGLIYVADNAFIKKNIELKELQLPRDQSFDVDYDFGNYKMTGTYIDPKNFEAQFPKLTKKF